MIHSMEKIEIIYPLWAPIYAFWGHFSSTTQTKQQLNSILNNAEEIVESFVQTHVAWEKFVYHVSLRTGKTQKDIEKILQPLTEALPSITINTIDE